MSAFAPIASTSTAGASSTSNGVHGTSATAPPDSALLTSLSARLVQSGEWNRILRMLDLKLNASGWDDEVRVHAQGPSGLSVRSTLCCDDSSHCWEACGDVGLPRPERARSQDPLNLSRLVEEITPHAQGTPELVMQAPDFCRQRAGIGPRRGRRGAASMGREGPSCGSDKRR